MENVEVALNVNEEIAHNPNLHLDKTNLSVTDITFDFGIEELLREIAIQKLYAQDPELKKREVAICRNETNNEVWDTLAENDEIYNSLMEKYIEVTDEYFILGFVEAYMMMWKLANNG